MRGGSIPSRRAARAVVAAARRLPELDLVVGTLGNVSARDGAHILITPTRQPYERLRARDLVVLDGDGVVVSGGHEPSREWRMHVEIYRARPDVGAVVHTHSEHATAWSFSGRGELPASEELEYYGIGRVGVSAPAPAASAQLAAAAVAALGRGRAALLGEHGAVAVGEDPDQALFTATLIERQARIACLAQALRRGG